MADGRQRRVSIASVAGERPGERRGWFLKKAKTSSSWAKAHHSHRYFVALGHALSYYDGMADSPQASAALRGVIDLREVKRVRPSGETALAPAKIFFLSLTRSLLSALSLSQPMPPHPSMPSTSSSPVCSAFAPKRGTAWL